MDSSRVVMRRAISCPRVGRELLSDMPPIKSKNFARCLTFADGLGTLRNVEPMPPSSRGLGHLPFTEATGIRIPLGVLI